jgi:hypothetical protein
MDIAAALQKGFEDAVLGRLDYLKARHGTPAATPAPTAQPKQRSSARGAAKMENGASPTGAMSAPRPPWSGRVAVGVGEEPGTKPPPLVPAMIPQLADSLRGGNIVVPATSASNAHV